MKNIANSKLKNSLNLNLAKSLIKVPLRQIRSRAGIQGIETNKKLPIVI
jgi:hypothetical protein